MVVVPLSIIGAVVGAVVGFVAGQALGLAVRGYVAREAMSRLR